MPRALTSLSIFYLIDKILLELKQGNSMKKLILLSVLFSVSISQSIAKTSKTSNLSTAKIGKIGTIFNKYKKGLRLGIATGTLETNIKAKANGVDKSVNDTDQVNYQLQVGYEVIKNKARGFSVYGIYQDIKNVSFSKENSRNMRLAGNITYGLNSKAYTFGGLNYSKYYGSKEVENDFNAGIGFQAGIGLKLHERANLEIEYLSLQNEGRNDGINYDMSAKGLMIKLNAPIFL